MIELNVGEVNNTFSRKYKVIKTNLEYERIMSKTAARLLCDIEYWWPKRKEEKLFKTDQELANETGSSLTGLKEAKKFLSNLNIISTEVHWRNGKKVTYYGPINYEKIEELLKGVCATVKCGIRPLLEQSKGRKSTYDSTKTDLCTLYTNNTTNITYNPAGLENNLPSNKSGLGNLSYNQKPMSVETDLPCSKEIILDQPPTLENEQSDQEGKALGTSSTSSLKAETVEAPQESKATKKATKIKPAKVIKTRINPNLELTPERRQVGLNARFLNRGLLEGVIETEFESFVDYFTETGTLRSDWDLSWKNWCKKAIELDKYNRKTIENPIRSGMTVSPPTEEKVSIDSAFAGFVKKKLNGMQFEFEGATYAEVDDRIVIDQQNSFRRELIEKLKDRLQQYFGKEIELKWLRNSWVVPTVSKQETEIVTAKSAQIVASDVSIPSPVFSPLCVEEVPLKTRPIFEAKTLQQEPSDRPGMDKTLNRLFKAIQERSGTVGEFKTNSENNLSEEKNNSSLTEEENDKEEVENDSDENQFYSAEQASESNPVMISASVEADLAVDQPSQNEDLQENRSEISITQTCLKLPNAIFAKPAEEEIRLKAREDVNNLPPPRTSNTTSAITNSPIKLSKPKSALHLPKFPVTAAKSFSAFPSTAQRLSDYAEMIRANLITASLRKEVPLGLFKPLQKSPFKPHCDIIPAKVVINAAQAVNGR